MDSGKTTNGSNGAEDGGSRGGGDLENNTMPSQPTGAPPTPPDAAKKANSSGRKARPRRSNAKSQLSSSAAAGAASSTPSSTTHPSDGPHLVPYPAHAFHPAMNPPYHINGAPFPHHHQQPPPPYPAQHINGQPPPPGAALHPQAYAYHIQPAYAPHPHAPYPPYATHAYPQQMLMYPPPRHSLPPDTPQSASAPSPVAHSPPGASASQSASAAASASAKRKRRSQPGASGGKSDDEGAASGSDIGRAHHQPQSQSQPQPQQHAGPSPSASDMKKRTKTQRACDSCRSRKIRCDILADAEPPVCQHCKQYGFECTFFLPITETRFKKKKLEEEQAAAAASADKDSTRGATSSPHGDFNSRGDIRIMGPTSPAHLLHSQSSINSRIYESWDVRHHMSWEVTQDGQGFIQVARPSPDPPQPSNSAPAASRALDVHLERDTLQQLLNAYFTDVAPLLPIVTQAEFVANPNPPPLLLYAMCLVAAARREVPQSVFDAMRIAVNGIIKAEDVLSTPSIVNVQALLILCMTGDCHSQYVPNALSALWVRLGVSIRMAQDLGLHRAESVKQNIELRRRLWGACVISDRWTSLTYGHPYMIDVQDCDARLPSSGDPHDLYMDELVRLSVILGRVLKTIYSPSGLTFATDEMLYELLHDIEAWKSNLPENLKFSGPETSLNGGLLHLLYASVCMIFWRVFMRISYTCPAQLKFGLTVENWTALVRLTGESIEWLDRHDRVYDVWLLVSYAATSCALVQYHTFVRRQDAEAVAKLRKLRDCVRRWEKAISPDHMSARRKTAEIITLLYEATQGPPLPVEQPPLNPTGGVKAKAPLGGLTYRNDPTRPGGGVFVAHGENRKEDLQDIPTGVVISSDEEASVEGDGQQGELSKGPDDSSTTVNITPLGPDQGQSHANVNPAMNNSAVSGNVHVLNMLDVPQASNSTLEQFASADTGFLEGIPGSMFDWGQWDTFFARFSGLPGVDAPSAGANAAMSAFTQQQRQQPQPVQQQREGGASPRVQERSSPYATSPGSGD